MGRVRRGVQVLTATLPLATPADALHLIGAGKVIAGFVYVVSEEPKEV